MAVDGGGIGILQEGAKVIACTGEVCWIWLAGSGGCPPMCGGCAGGSGGFCGRLLSVCGRGGGGEW